MPGGYRRGMRILASADAPMADGYVEHLSVPDLSVGSYRIPAGGRRYRAIERLVAQKRLAKTAGVPCIVSKGETLEVEDSLAENVQRVSLHPLDQFRALLERIVRLRETVETFAR